MSEQEAHPDIRVAVDTGGTFTDVVAVITSGGDTTVAVAKVPSTPDNPARAVLAGIRKVLEPLGFHRPEELVHGTTVATNALLERKGADVDFVTNAGFEDLLLIGRQARPDLYALEPVLPKPLVARDRTIGVVTRRDHQGDVIETLDLDALDRALAKIAAGSDAATPRTWAICLLHSYVDDTDERAIADRIRVARPHDQITLSSELLPVYREVERASTTVANAYLRPLLHSYLGELRIAADTVSVMGSSGGRLALADAQRAPVHTALSGPAGGVVAAQAIADQAGFDGMLSFDMGGTSTDVALLPARDGQGDDGAIQARKSGVFDPDGPATLTAVLPIRHSSTIGGIAVHVPMLDIHTVGAGGGSIASVDIGGALQVGPQSAGAAPGPASYGNGGPATVTDANVVLGRLPGGTLLGGVITVDAAAADAAFEPIAAALGTTIEEAARGTLRIAVEKMAQAVRKVSVERGVDPRGFALCAFGGAGGLHACELAEELGISTIIVPGRAGLLSAVGMLRGPAVAERARTVLGGTDEDVSAVAARLQTDVNESLPSVARLTVSADMRYVGQSFEIDITLSESSIEVSASALARARDVFEAEHERLFGYRAKSSVELVTVRVRAEGPRPRPFVLTEERDAEAVVGPATLHAFSVTTWVAANWTARPRSDGGWQLTR